MSSLCCKTGMSRQNYYAGRRQRQRRSVDSELLVQLVLKERKSQPRLGTRKLHWMLREELQQAGVKIGRDRMFEELRARDLLVPPLPTGEPKTTNSYHPLPVFQNLIKDKILNGPNQVWVCDLTYLRTEENFLYLALITDKYSRKIVGYHVGCTLEAIGCIKALEMATQDLPEQCKPIQHSDRGIQYCCRQYIERLQERGLPISMTERDHCAENALAERMNGILKQEYGLGGTHKTKAQARQAVDEAVLLYNTRRPHTALDYCVPEDVHKNSKLN